MYTLNKLKWDLEAYSNLRKPFPCRNRKLLNDESRMLIITNINRWALYGPLDAFTTCVFYMDIFAGANDIDFLIQLGTRTGCGTVFGFYRMRTRNKKSIAEPRHTRVKKIVFIEELSSHRTG